MVEICWDLTCKNLLEIVCSRNAKFMLNSAAEYGAAFCLPRSHSLFFLSFIHFSQSPRSNSIQLIRSSRISPGSAACPAWWRCGCENGLGPDSSENGPVYGDAMDYIGFYISSVSILTSYSQWHMLRYEGKREKRIDRKAQEDTGRHYWNMLQGMLRVWNQGRWCHAHHHGWPAFHSILPGQSASNGSSCAPVLNTVQRCTKVYKVPLEFHYKATRMSVESLNTATAATEHRRKNLRTFENFVT